MAEPLEEEVNRSLRRQVVVCFDYQVFEFGYVPVDFWVFELQFVELVSGAKFACGVHELFPEGLLEFVPYCGYIVVHRVESSDGVNHIFHP